MCSATTAGISVRECLHPPVSMYSFNRQVCDEATLSSFMRGSFTCKHRKGIWFQNSVLERGAVFHSDGLSLGSRVDLAKSLSFPSVDVHSHVDDYSGTLGGVGKHSKYSCM